MVTQAKKPHPRKKRTRVEEPAAEMAAPAMTTEEESMPQPAPQEIPSYAAPIAEEQDDDESPSKRSMEPTAFAKAANDGAQSAAKKSSAKRMDAFQDRSEQSDEPDFGLGIGDILRSDENLKAKLKMQERSESARLGQDDGRLSIDSILRGDTMPAPTQKEDDEEEESEMSYMDHEEPRSGRSGAKTAALVLLVLLLFVAAAGGVYMFLAKSGLPSFAGLFKKSSGAMQQQAVNAQPAGPKAPSSVSVTVLVGTTAPATPGAKEFIASRVIDSEGKTSGTFPATGAASSKIDKSTGKATIVNTTAKAYTFVATTRLLSKEGVLFRMNATTPIPANGSVTVDVHADQPGAEGDLGPTTFTIPGLPPDLQKQITAKSDAPMTGGAGTGLGVSQSDIDSAKASLTDKLREEAVGNFAAMLSPGEKTNADMITSKELAVTAPKIGTAGATFPLTLSLRFSALLVPEKSIAPLLDKALSEAMPPSLSTADYTLGSYIYTVQAYDITAGTAEVRVEAPVIRN